MTGSGLARVRFVHASELHAVLARRGLEPLDFGASCTGTGSTSRSALGARSRGRTARSPTARSRRAFGHVEGFVRISVNVRERTGRPRGNEDMEVGVVTTRACAGGEKIATLPQDPKALHGGNIRRIRVPFETGRRSSNRVLNDRRSRDSTMRPHTPGDLTVRSRKRSTPRLDRAGRCRCPARREAGPSARSYWRPGGDSHAENNSPGSHR
jgi:hypothetical protein